MVIVKISGGLGNQLFQYTFGNFISKKLNTVIKYDIHTIQNRKDFTIRNFELSEFGINIQIATVDEISEMKYFSDGILESLERKIVQKYPSLFKSYFVESIFYKLVENRYIRDNCYYDGYWQSYKYLSENSIFQEDGILIDKSFNQAVKHLMDIIDCSNAVSIHIRRGDYITIKKNLDFFGLCSINFYKNAIQYISNILPNLKFFIFSDDQVWAKNNFIGPQYFFVSGNKPIEDMYLMSRCKHNIVANSSFSWWGAWMNRNPDKIIIAPKNWLAKEPTIDLIPDSWIRLDN